MKILYALPATGNGHISRANEIYPHLKKYGEVDFLVSGINSNLQTKFPIKYSSKGISLFYNSKGGLDYSKFLKNIHLPEIWREINELPIKQYDWVISDFEPLSAWACKKRKQFCMQWGHQASFVYKNVPRPKIPNHAGELVLRKYTPGDINFGLHFDSYHSLISGPVIREDVFKTKAIEKNHITIYLNQYPLSVIIDTFDSLKNIDIHVFTHEVQVPKMIENFHLFPIDKNHFFQSMSTSKMVITGAGFETPSEVIFLNKRLICIPVKHHYEQQCNAVALQKKGVVVFQKLEPSFLLKVHEMLQSDPSSIRIPFQNTETIVEEAFALWEEQRTIKTMEEIDFEATENLFC